MKYKLAIITLFMGIGGVENVIYTLANYFKKHFEIHFISRCTRPAGIQKKYFEIGSVVHLFGKNAIYRYLRANGIDLAFTPNGFVERFLKRKKFPFIMWRVHGGRAYSDFSLCINPALHNKNRWHCIPDPVDTELIKQEKTDRVFGRSRIVVGMATRLSRIKNLDLLIRVVSILQKRYPHVCLELLGSRTFIHDGGIRYTKKQIRKKCQRHLLKGSFCLFTTENPVPYIKGMDIAVCTSKKEGLPLFLLEAAACGKPLVSSDVGYIRGFIRHGENGYVVAPGDLRGFYAALEKFVRDPVLRKKTGRSALESVLQFDIKKIGPRFHDIFLACLNTYRGGNKRR